MERSAELGNEGPPATSRNDELAEHLRNLQRQLIDLELAAHEKKRPWWRQPAVIISVLSLTISASLSLYTQFDQSRQRGIDAAKQRAAALDATLSEIVAVRMEDTKQMVALASSNVAAYRAWTSTASVKRAALIESAMSQLAKLNADVSPATALTMGNELVIDGRYPEAKRLLESGIASARRSKTSFAALSSALALVYLSPGSPVFDASRGRELYKSAIDSYPAQADYYVLNTKLGAILYWAANERAFGNEAASDQLVRQAQDLVWKCGLPAAAKGALQAVLDGVKAQLNLQAPGPSLFNARLVGRWRVVEQDSESGNLIFISGSTSSLASFTKNRINGGKLVERIGGVAMILDQTHLRLDWATAFDTGVPGFQKVGYSDVTLEPDSTLRGTDIALAMPPRNWTARLAP